MKMAEKTKVIDIQAIKQEVKEKQQSDRSEKLSALWGDVKNVIIGISLLLVVASITYADVVIWTGTTGIVPKIMTIPSGVFAAVLILNKFVK
jgi:hypothetical protein